MFDFLKPCLNAGGEFLTGTVVVQALDSETGQGLFGVRAIVGGTLEAAVGKTWGGRLGVTGRDGTCRIDFSFGRIYVAVSESNHVEEWLSAGEDLDITFRLPGPASRRPSWGCPVCGSHVRGSTAGDLTPCRQCGSRSLLAGSISGFSLAPQMVLIVSPPPTASANSMPAFFHGVTSQLAPDSRLIIDVTQAGLTSEAMASLVLMNRQAKHAQRWLPEFVVPDEHPGRHLLRVTRLDQVFHVHTTVEAALAALT